MPHLVTLLKPLQCLDTSLYGELGNLCSSDKQMFMLEGRDKEGKQALERLRGANNIDIIEAEFNMIMINLKNEEKEMSINNESSCKSQMKDMCNFLTDMTFLKPFAYLMFVFLIGMEWTGFPAIAFYMVSLLR